MTFPVLTDLSAFRLVSLTGVATLAAALFAFLAAWGVCHMVYNVFFHPLRKIPGPFLAGACGIPHVRHVRNGTIAPWLKKLHEKYGDAVRIAPAEVSFISADTAWQDIYGHRTGQHKGMPTLWKNVDWYPAPANGVYSMVNAAEEDHSRMRRVFAHAFSDKALRAQEPLVRSYTDLFIQRIHEHAAAGKPMEMVAWYNYVTFDIITDLAFGETLYCLRDSKAHEWVTIAYSAFKAAGLRYTRLTYRLVWWYDALRSLFKDTKTFENRARIFSRKTSEAVSKRLEQLEQNPNDGKGDFMSYVPRGDDKDPRKTLTRKELDTNAVLFLIAGSETTATTLEGTTYLLLKNPDAYAKLTHEIRSTFSSAEEITFEKTAHLEYLTAVITEGLRMYPPVPTGFARKTPPCGAVVSGRYIPGNTTLYVSQYTANHSPRNFVNPDKFAPERWLGAEEYKDDKKSVWNPFSYGPGNCIGKNLAWNELRLTLSQILFEFDLELVDKEHDWLNDQKIFTLWDKKDLNVKFTPIRGKA